ncbi:MAG: GAF domain-containing protein [Chloroflexota bacterium]|nr:GAF domain-containing protein [Chloroflexota bacterium]
MFEVGAEVEERLSCLDHVPIGMFILRKDFIVLFWNSCLEDWTGIPRSAVVGESIGTFFPHLRDPKYTVRLKNIFEGGPPVIFSSQLHQCIIALSPLQDGQLRIQHTTVTSVPALDGTGFYALFAIQDVTALTHRVQEYRVMRDQALAEASERERAEEALRQRNRELALLNRAGQVLTSTLDLDQVLVTVLEEVRRLLGVVASSIWLADPDTGELVCRQATGPQSEIVRGWRLAPDEGFVGWVAHSGESLVVPDTWTDERHFKGVDMETGLLLRSILSVPLRVKRGVIGVLQVVDSKPDRFDSADLTLLEPLATSAAIAIDNAGLVEALRQRTIELEARNEELDAFAHTAAHDLKGPLGYMVGFARVLEQDYSTLSDDDLRRYLRTIAKSGHKMSNIIDAILLLASAHKLEEADLTLLDMPVVVDDALQRLAYMIEEYQAEIVLPDAWPMALGYRPWVEEIWVNYLSNALKYGARPPRVELGATSLPEGKAGERMVRFWVRDDGPGLTLEEQARLFTPFTRLDQVRAKGYGLGLSIVKRIAEKLGGEVGIESEVGQGSVFSFTLPGVAEGET